MKAQLRPDDPLPRLVRDVGAIQNSLRNVVSNLPLFDISSENTPPVLFADQNDYDIGHFDVLRLSGTAPRTITGFAGGAKGRVLRIFNVGAYDITIPYDNAGSLAQNQVTTAGSANDAIIASGGEIFLYYDLTSLRWRTSYNSNATKIGCEVRRSVNQTIQNSTLELVSWDLVVSDVGGFFSIASPTYITIPEAGWYVVDVQVDWFGNDVGARYVILNVNPILPTPNIFLASIVPPCIGGVETVMAMSRSRYFDRLDHIYTYALQDSGGNLDIANSTIPTYISVVKM